MQSQLKAMWFPCCGLRKKDTCLRSAYPLSSRNEIRAQLQGIFTTKGVIIGGPIPGNAWRHLLEYLEGDTIFLHYISPRFLKDGFIIMILSTRAMEVRHVLVAASTCLHSAYPLSSRNEIRAQLQGVFTNKSVIIGGPIPGDAWRHLLEYLEGDTIFLHYISPCFLKDGFIIMILSTRTTEVRHVSVAAIPSIASS